MRNITPRPLLCVLTVIGALAVDAPKALSEEQFPQRVVSLHDIHLVEGERIVGLEITFTAASVYAITHIPKDWSFNLDGAVSYRTKLSGACHHGAGALETARGLPQFTIILEPPFDRTSPKFDISGSVHLTKDFEKARLLKLKITDFQIESPGR